MTRATARLFGALTTAVGFALVILVLKTKDPTMGLVADSLIIIGPVLVVLGIVVLAAAFWPAKRRD